MAFAPWEHPAAGGSGFEEQMSALARDTEYDSGAIDSHTADAKRFFQWTMDTNVRWQRFQSEHQTKAGILNALSKLEDKYQVRG